MCHWGKKLVSVGSGWYPLALTFLKSGLLFYRRGMCEGDHKSTNLFSEITEGDRKSTNLFTKYVFMTAASFGGLF